MQFLADVELICEECKGTRYKPQVLDVRYRGKNIHDVLNLTVKEALKFFAEVPKITEKLRSLEEVGLGYLRLGQSATTLSGGEAQRMKLAAHLQPATRDSGRPSAEKLKRRLLYIFDEPTTGLHFDDVSKLLAAFRRLIEAGDSIVVRVSHTYTFIFGTIVPLVHPTWQVEAKADMRLEKDDSTSTISTTEAACT